MLGDSTNEFTETERKVAVVFEDRDFSNKVCRVFYRILNDFYKVFWYYFAPFIALFLSYLIPYVLGGYETQ